MVNSEILDQLPPSSVEAEQALLGSVILVPSLMEDLSWLPARDFYAEAHQIIWAAMLELQKDGGVVDETSLAERLRELGKYEAVGGRPYIYEALADSVGSPGSAPEHARTVKAFAAMRRARNACLEVVQTVHGTGRPAEILRAAELKLSACVSETGGRASSESGQSPWIRPALSTSTAWASLAAP